MHFPIVFPLSVSLVVPRVRLSEFDTVNPLPSVSAQAGREENTKLLALSCVRLRELV